MWRVKLVARFQKWNLWADGAKNVLDSDKVSVRNESNVSVLDRFKLRKYLYTCIYFAISWFFFTKHRTQSKGLTNTAVSVAKGAITSQVHKIRVSNVDWRLEVLSQEPRG